MAINKNDIKELSNEDLLAKIAEEKLNYTKTQFNHSISDLDNPLVLRSMRRDIARLNTELRRRQLEQNA